MPVAHNDVRLAGAVVKHLERMPMVAIVCCLTFVSHFAYRRRSNFLDRMIVVESPLDKEIADNRHGNQQHRTHGDKSQDSPKYDFPGRERVS